MKTKTPHTPVPKFVVDKLAEIQKGYFLDAPPALVDVNAPRALMQAIGEGWSQGIRWATFQPLYAAAPDLLVSAKAVMDLASDMGFAGCLGHEPAHPLQMLRAAISKAEGK